MPSIQLKFGLKPVAQTIFLISVTSCFSKVMLSAFASNVLPTQVMFSFLNSVFTSVPITGCPVLLSILPIQEYLLAVKKPTL